MAKRQRKPSRTIEEQLKDIEAKIKRHEDNIETLKSKRQTLLRRQKNASVQELAKMLQRNNISVEDAEKIINSQIKNSESLTEILNENASQ